jgi:hypothetical protein
MTREQIKEMIMDLLGQVDYDIMKSYLPECSEDPEGSAESMERLIDLCKKHIKGSKK